MKNQALHWLAFTYLVSRAEWTTEPCAEPGNAEASRRKVQSTQDAEQGATSNQAIRKQGGRGQILNPFPLAQGYGKVTWSPEARKSPWGLLPFKAQSRVPSFSSKTQQEICFPLYYIIVLKDAAPKKESQKQFCSLPEVVQAPPFHLAGRTPSHGNRSILQKPGCKGIGWQLEHSSVNQGCRSVPAWAEGRIKWRSPT